MILLLLPYGPYDPHHLTDHSSNTRCHQNGGRIRRTLWTHSSRMTKFGCLLKLLFLYLYCFGPNNNISSTVVYGWEWSDFVWSTNHSNNNTITNWISSTIASSASSQHDHTNQIMRNHPLSIHEISQLRVRDVRRRLVRIHGYAPEEIQRILEKKELINTLAYEEEKIRLSNEVEARRIVITQCLFTTFVVIVITICWPLILHAYEVIHVNIIVFLDRKKYEATRCYELQSYYGLIGILAMGLIDLCKVWLTGSILLSWFIKSNRYFFPTPSWSIRPMEMLKLGSSTNHQYGYHSHQNPVPTFGNFGINIGPMIIRWLLGFIYIRIEKWTARSMAHSQKLQQQRQQQARRQNETVEGKQARKEAKRQRKIEKQMMHEQQEKILYAQYQQQQQYRRQHQQQLHTHQEPPSNGTVTSHVRTTNVTATYDNDNQREWDGWIDNNTDPPLQQPQHPPHQPSSSSFHLPPESNTHQEFLKQINDLDNNYDDYQYVSELDDLD
jgi:hypothetical protein